MQQNLLSLLRIHNPGVPTVAQWKRIRLVVMTLWVRSLASLRDGVSWTPSLGTSMCHGYGPKKRKKKNKKEDIILNATQVSGSVADEGPSTMWRQLYRVVLLKSLLQAKGSAEFSSTPFTWHVSNFCNRLTTP